MSSLPVSSFRPGTALVIACKVVSFVLDLVMRKDSPEGVSLLRYKISQTPSRMYITKRSSSESVALFLSTFALVLST